MCDRFRPKADIGAGSDIWSPMGSAFRGGYHLKKCGDMFYDTFPSYFPRQISSVAVTQSGNSLTYYRNCLIDSRQAAG